MLDAQARKSMVEFLQDHHCRVTFKKADGSIREMKCTLMPKYIEEHNTTVKTTDRGYTQNTEFQVVFDTEKNAWRKFGWDSVMEFCLL
jgi:hypothetical protein